MKGILTETQKVKLFDVIENDKSRGAFNVKDENGNQEIIFREQLLEESWKYSPETDEIYCHETTHICEICKQEAFYNDKTNSYECVICNE